MTKPDINPTADGQTGVPQELAPNLRCILADNPSPMTYHGTNTYLLGARDIAVIDPGPASQSHLNAILSALRPGQRITHILVTHSHMDHSPLAASLAQQTGAPIMAFGDSTAGRSAAMQRALTAGLTSGGEGIDADFAPTDLMRDGESYAAGDQQVTALHTPGHMGNHMCFAWNNAVFCGDLVMGWASSLVSPPDGDLTDFMASCRRLQTLSPHVLYSGHGAPITDPAARLSWLIEHRLMREAQILQHLADAPGTPASLAAAIYTETPAALLPAAARNVFAHLIDLMDKKLVTCGGAPTETATYTRV